MSSEEESKKKHLLSSSFKRPVSNREWIQRYDAVVKENEELRQTIEDYKRDTAVYMSAINEADDMAKASVQKQMAQLRAENSALKQKIEHLEVKLCVESRIAEQFMSEYNRMQQRLAEASEGKEVPFGSEPW